MACHTSILMHIICSFFFFNDTATTEIYTLSLHDALPIYPITGRGLKQLLPEVAKSYREQRSFVVQQAARVRELVLTGNRELSGTLRPSLVQQGIVDVRRDLDEAVRSRTVAGNVMDAQAASLLLRDTTARASALRALDFMLDTTAGVAGEDPAGLVRAALVGTVAEAWIVTADNHYREAGRRSEEHTSELQSQS